MMQRWLQNHRTTIFLVGLLLTGLGLLAYPTLSDRWNLAHQAQVITTYVENTENLTEQRNEKILEEAQNYNQTLAENGNHWEMSVEEKEAYEQLLKFDSTGIMAYIEIPVIDCSLPIYHGSDEAILQVGAGHIEGSSLPIGGESTHCAVAGHRGLPSSKLFTDLDKLVQGDTFMLHTLGKTLNYEVDQICIVEPTDFSELEIVGGEDYCTLVTCTPYAVNTHRLLVRGHRIHD